VLKPFEAPQYEDGEGQGGEAQPQLTTTETQPHYGRIPDSGGGGDPFDEVAATHDRTRADKADPRQDAERQPHQIHRNE
jgi:hypothetical protein